MRRDDSLEYVKTYFLEGEICLFWQWLPRFYAVCLPSVLLLLFYAALLSLLLYFYSFAILFLIVWTVYGGLYLARAYAIRIACRNLFVVTQHAVYRYFRIQEERVDEFRWKDVRKVKIRSWRIAPSLATVTIYRRRRAVREHPLVRRILLYRNRYKRPEELDFRELSLSTPHVIRVVIRNHEELYRLLKGFQETEGYIYILQRRGRRHAK